MMNNDKTRDFEAGNKGKKNYMFIIFIEWNKFHH